MSMSSKACSPIFIKQTKNQTIMEKETKDTYEGMLESAISWFEDIAEMCSKLTTGNVSHQGASIKGKAIRAAEYIKKRIKGGE